MNSNKILVPVTLAEGSRAALTIASSMAAETGATLVLLHVTQLHTTREEQGVQRERMLNNLTRDAGRRLRELAANARLTCPVEFQVYEGRPVDKIVRCAQDSGAEAIVMSTHGGRGWFNWMHRNVARRVSEQAPCAVWLVTLTPDGESLSLSYTPHGVRTAQSASHRPAA